MGLNVFNATYDTVSGQSLDDLRNATYDTVSGQSLDDLRIATFTGASPIVTSSTLNLRLRSQTAALFGSVGLTDDFDVAVAVPIVRVQLDATLVQEEAAIGTAILQGSRSSTGLGDIALMGKYRFWKSADDRSGLAGLVTLRAPTGDEDDLRGIRAWRTLLGLTASAGFGRAAVHLSGGYEFWDKSVSLSNTRPGNELEVWQLSDQVQYGAAVEFEIDQRLTLSVEAMGRWVRNSGRLETISFDQGSPELGIAGVDLLQAKSGTLRKIVVVPAIKWNVGGNALLSFGLRTAQNDTSLRDKLTPLLGFNWTL